MQKVIIKPWEYALYESDSNYLLEVLCGGVGMYFIKLYLVEDEIANYLELGEPYINEIAKAIQKNPSEYLKRDIQNLP